MVTSVMVNTQAQNSNLPWAYLREADPRTSWAKFVDMVLGNNR